MKKNEEKSHEEADVNKIRMQLQKGFHPHFALSHL